MRITVGEEFIREAKERRKGKDYFPACHCPIALAVKAALGRDDILVTLIGISGSGLFVHLPEKAKAFIRDFDSGKEVRAFSFVAKRVSRPVKKGEDKSKQVSMQPSKG